MKHLAVLLWCVCVQIGGMARAAAQVTATRNADGITVESTGGPISYKVLVDPKRGGDICDLRIPASASVVGRELNGIFFHGIHGEEYTLRGWTGLSKFDLACTAEIESIGPQEVVAQVDLITTGTFKILVEDAAAKAKLRKEHVSYKDKTMQFKRRYTFQADRIIVEDQATWLHPDMQFNTCYFTSGFVPNVIQGPARLVKDGKAAAFEVTTSGGHKIPAEIAYPFTTENYLKTGYVVSQTTSAASFDLSSSNFFYYEKPWQQDWDQLAGFMYKLAKIAEPPTIRLTHQITFSKATLQQMPPVVTIESPAWDARWLDEKGEVPKYKIGDTLKLIAHAVNSDGTAVPDNAIEWEIHIDPWWNTPSVKLRGSKVSYQLPQVSNAADIEKSKDRPLLAIVTVRAKGKNGTQAVEPFAMLVGR